MSKEDLIDLLKSLSRIEGVAMGMKDKEASNAITDELSWATDKIVELLKES